MPPKRRKTPSRTEQPFVLKQPKVFEGTSNSGGIVWRFSAADKDGPFPFHAIHQSDVHEAIIARLAEFERMNWAEVKNTGSHPIPCAQLAPIARDRLSTIKQDDLDELMSFRIDGAGRLWCIMDQNIMRILWWDPRHEVYPVEKDRADRKKRRNRR